MLPNWLYGKSKSKLAELLGGGGTPSDYNQVKAQVTANTENIATNTEDIASLDDAVDTKAALTQISNPNLLDNPWFTVNQRGESSYSVSDYTVDRWKTPNGDMSVTVNDGYITLTSSTGNAEFSQIIAYNELGKYLLGKTVTLSIISNGNLHSFNLTIPSSIPSSDNMVGQLLIDSEFDLELYVTASGNILVTIGTLALVSSEVSINITCVKLELGSVSTLAMDTAPNYTTELLKCQRYFENDIIFFKYINGQTLVDNSVAFKVQKRTTPTMTVYSKDGTSGNCSVWNGSAFVDKAIDMLYVINNSTARVRVSSLSNDYIQYRLQASADL